MAGTAALLLAIGTFHLVLAIGLLGSWFITRESDEIITDRPATPPLAA